MDNRFREQYKSFPTEKLVVIAASETSDYKVEAIGAARNELKTRGESWNNADAPKTASIDVDRGKRSGKRISRPWIAFFLGVFAFVLLANFIPDRAGLFVTATAMAVYFFVCQLGLSWGHIAAHRKDWPVMIALDGFMIVLILLNRLVEKHPMVPSEAIGLLMVAWLPDPWRLPLRFWAPK